MAAGASRIYLRSWTTTSTSSIELLVRCWPTAATKQRAGLNLREFGLSMLNRFDDRLYFGTDSGMVLCLRESAPPSHGCSAIPRPCLSATYHPRESSRRHLQCPRPRRPPTAQGAGYPPADEMEKPAPKAAAPKAATPKAATPKAARKAARARTKNANPPAPE